MHKVRKRFVSVATFANYSASITQNWRNDLRRKMLVAKIEFHADFYDQIQIHNFHIARVQSLKYPGVLLNNKLYEKQFL